MAATDRLCGGGRGEVPLLLLSFFSFNAAATVLPEERLDVMYHSYSGGGVRIDGPSILVRKNVGNSVSLSGKYYVDTVSGASIDVQAAGVDVDSGASPYREKRTEYSVGMDYLHDRTLISFGYTRSRENDYDADTFNFAVNQTFFGDLTTITLSAGVGHDTVGRNDREDFEEELERRRYGIGLTQILTPSLIAAIHYEAVLDEGYINNPYRQARYRDPGTARGFSYQPEVYPNTRNSDAVSVRAIYHLPWWRSALRGEYRYFEDNWDISSDTTELRYTHVLYRDWLLEFKLRHYSQTGAIFYSDLFEFRDAQNFMARDKEMGPFTSLTLGAGASYTLPAGWVPGFSRSTVNLYLDRIAFSYKDFRDARVTPGEYNPGEEPLYNFNATVVRLYLSFWF